MDPLPVAGTPCSQCGDIIAPEHAPKRGRICIPCRRANGRRHYRENQDYYVKKARRHHDDATKSTQAWVIGFLQESRCSDCGAADPRILEFDHVDPTEKRDHVSALIANGYSLATVMAEIAKCEVRCANCHLIRTRIQRGWWKAALTS